MTWESRLGVLDVVASMRRRPRWFENLAIGSFSESLAAGK